MTISPTAPLDGATAALQNLEAWAKQPFSTSMNLKGWFAWTGLVVIIVIAWIMILKEFDTIA